jgi:hypothetical protein
VSNSAFPKETIRQELERIQVALVKSQDAVDDRIFDALSQFLRIARKTELDVHSLSDVQSKMKETLD